MAQESGNKMCWVLAVTTSPRPLEPLTGSHGKVNQLGRELPAGPSHTEESLSCLLLSMSDGQVVSSCIFNQALLGIVRVQLLASEATCVISPEVASGLLRFSHLSPANGTIFLA